MTKASLIWFRRTCSSAVSWSQFPEFESIREILFTSDDVDGDAEVDVVKFDVETDEAWAAGVEQITLSEWIPESMLSDPGDSGLSCGAKKQKVHYWAIIGLLWK